MGCQQDPSAGHNHGSLDDISEFADIARPVVALQTRQHLRIDAGDPGAVLLVQVPEHRVRQSRNIVQPPAERRQFESEDIEAIIKVLAQESFPDSVFWISIRRGYDPNIHNGFRLSAQSADARVLEDSKQLGLRANGHFSQLVQQERATLSELETPGTPLYRAGERALFMAEELTLHQGFRKRGAIDGYKRTGTTRAQLMDGASHQLLAGAALSRDQHGGLRRRHLAHKREDLVHGLAISDQFAEHALITQLPLEPFGLLRQAVLHCRPFEQEPENPRLNRLFEKPEGAQLVQGGESRFDISEGRDHDGGDAASRGIQAPEKLGPVDARHHEIRENYLGMKDPKLFECVLSIKRGFSDEPPAGDHAGESKTLVLFIVHDQDTGSSAGFDRRHILTTVYSGNVFGQTKPPVIIVVRKLKGAFMKGNEKVIAYLSEVLKGELTAINQYFLHAEMLNNWGYKKLYGYTRKESIEEMVHAEELMERILFLDATPNMSEMFPLRIGKNVKEQFENDLKLELEAVPRLNEAIKVATEAHDNGSRDLFEKILVDEEEHIDWLEAQLHMIREVGIDNYLATQIHEDEKKDH